MLKILNTQQIKQLDAFTIEHEPVKSIDLMERACEAFTYWFTQRFDASHKVGVVCGTGNNGGDGLGIARKLSELHYPVKVWIVRGKAPITTDFEINFGRLKGKVEMNEIISESDQNLFSDRHILIDAIFGSGLSRPAEGIYAQAIRCTNQTNALRVAVDIPSGLMADQLSSGEIVRADYTVSFQLPKLAFLLPENFQFVGEWHLADIALSRSGLKELKTNHFLLERKDIRKRILKRSKFDHKGSFGHALLIAGGFGKMGASVLASRGCLRAGAGLVTVRIPRSGYGVIQSTVPEAMASMYEDGHLFSDDLEMGPFNVIGVGPGIGQTKEMVMALRKVLEWGKPMVLDADALNIISAHRELLSIIPQGSILTPHPKEFERLVGAWKNDFERLELQVQLARQLKSVVILKGAYSSIATPEGNVYFNATGNPGMATGGSGDVLTGIVTGLLAQKYSAESSAIVSVFLHGLSGDLAARDKGQQSLIASDLVDYLPSAFKTLSV